MTYRWFAEGQIELYRRRPAQRFIITTLGGYFPVMQKLAGGTLMVIARDGDFHVGQRGRLIAITSPDGGESWTSPTVVANDGPDNRNPAFGQASDGTLLVAFMKLDMYENGRYIRESRPDDPDRPIYLTRAVAAGTPWSAPEELQTPPSRLSPYGKIARLPDGMLVMNVYGRLREDYGREHSYSSFLMRSHDNGRTWQDFTLIATGGFNETALLGLPNGRLLAALRREYPGRRMGANVWLAASDDGGLTWSEPRQLTDHGEHPGDLLLLRDSRVLLTYGHRNPPYGVRAMVSADGGESWDAGNRITLVADAIIPDCGYPSSVQLDDGSILTAYYAYESVAPFQSFDLHRLGIHAAAIRYRPEDLG